VSWDADNCHHLSVKNNRRQLKILCKGKAAIVVYICQPLRTQHDEHIFTRTSHSTR